MATMNKDEDQCVICFTSLSKTLLISTECNHRFHLDCIRQNIENGNNKCPLCCQPLPALVSHFVKDGQLPVSDTTASGKKHEVASKTTETGSFFEHFTEPFSL